MSIKDKYKNGDIIGDSGLIFLEFLPEPNKRLDAKFRCFCGKEFVSREYAVKTGHTRSCGCVQRESAKKLKTNHSLGKHPSYKSAVQQWYRCHDPKHRHYELYKSRGTQADNMNEHIQMIAKWWDDNQDTYFDGATIDRIDNNRGYYLDNLRWATKRQQVENRSNTIVCKAIRDGNILIEGTLMQIAEFFRLSYSIVAGVYRNGNYSKKHNFEIRKIGGV